jgi:predicted transcriptional regulator
MRVKTSTTSFRFSDDAAFYIAAIAKKLGISKTAVIEIALRKLAEAENIKAE